jgi:hypothetical protein
MDSHKLARYIEATDSISKPWLLAQLRLCKLKERQAEMSPDEYATELNHIYESVMNLGEWWKGIEDEVF